MSNFYEVIKDRGFVYQCTDEEKLPELFDQERVTAYIGFDATADSFHVGSLVPIMALAWFQRTGHLPVALVGGGTTMVGDPSGKTEARQLLSPQNILRNMEGLKRQLAHYLSFEADQALMLDNGDWLLGLNYIEFLRDIGRHFSVNRMLASESYKQRLETGLTFIEFNYMLLQAYDFLVLFQRHGNKVQMGGQDQWGNIVAGIDLIRRVEGEQTYGLTFPLLEDPRTGAKFGKTHAGAVWLDKDKTPPYDFFQFWRNIDDLMLERCLGLFTFLPMDEVRRLAGLEGTLINRAKEILAYEVTVLAHGPDEAVQAYLASIQAFGSADPEGRVETSSPVAHLRADAIRDLPTTVLGAESIAAGISAVDLFILADLAGSKGESRRLIRGGGAYIQGERIEKEDQVFTAADLENGALILRAGKKRYHRLYFGRTAECP
ncbi:MAG: tyrosine--tRNA ligase [Pseudomonadota bacterium]